jgi:hypothetical protein
MQIVAKATTAFLTAKGANQVIHFLFCKITVKAGPKMCIKRAHPTVPIAGAPSMQMMWGPNSD